MEYKRTIGACPLRDFHKICRVCTLFRDALAARGYGVMGVLSSGGLVTPNFQRPLAAKLCETMTPKVLEVQERVRGPLSPNVDFFLPAALRAAQCASI